MFQNGLEKHKLCFCAVAVVVQLQLLECPTWQTDYAVGVYEGLEKPPENIITASLDTTVDPGCRNAGVKFKWCSLCVAPVAERNFNRRHTHSGEKPKGALNKSTESPSSGKRSRQKDDLLEKRPSSSKKAQVDRKIQIFLKASQIAKQISLKVAKKLTIHLEGAVTNTSRKP
jgi:hypothetical protein